PNRTLVILPTAILTNLNNIPNPISPTPLIWRPNYDDRSTAVVATEFILNQLQPKLNAQGINPIKIAIAAEGNPLGLSMQQQMLTALKFNGTADAPLSAAQNQAAGNLITLNFGDTSDTLNNPNPDGKIGQALASIFQFKPNIILHSYAVAPITKF